VDNCAISGNATNGGQSGGVFVQTGATLNMHGCTISGNHTLFEDGAGVENHGTATLTNCTITGNTSQHPPVGTNGGRGGGLANVGGTLTLLNCTVEGNTGDDGGGGIIAESGGSFQLSNTIVAGNTTPGTGPDCLGNFGSGGYNLIGIGNGSTGFVNNVNHDLVGTTAAPRFALLGALANFGGGTDTLPVLFASSPEVNTANPATAPARDQRGFVRSGNPDIGAFEFLGTQPVTLANISSRAVVQTGDNVLIGGFIITGTQPKKVILRAIGPSLNLPGKLSNPVLELYNSTQLVTSNDDWGSAPNVQEIIDTTIAPTNPLESAILMSLSPGSYTAIVRGAGGATGIGVVEAYDLDRTVNSRLANISTRAAVQTGDNVLIGGFIVLGPDSLKVIIRAIGLSLSGIPNHMLDPMIELHDVNGATLATNDNWRSTQEATIIATGIPPSNDAEAAIVRTLVPGNYTAIVSGVNNTSGVAVVEVYGLLP
jgi:hypothetical protein